MWRRVLPIYQVHVLLFVGTYFFKVLRKTRFFWHLEGFGFEHEEFSCSEPPLSFTEEEEAFGWAELEKIGIAKTDWFICFHARDPAYLGRRENFGTQTLIENIRDCSVENYLLAAEWIAEQGGFAIRMGAIVENPLSEDIHPNVIDYSTQHYTDFLDIFLAAKCKFFLGNSSGITWVPLSFGGLMGAANMVPLHDIGHGNRCLFIPKILKNRTGELVSIDRIRALELGELSRKTNQKRYTKNFYNLLGMSWDENSKEDILDFCKDLMQFASGKAPKPLNKAQRAFHEIYASTNHDCLYAPQVGPSFARKYYNP